MKISPYSSLYRKQIKQHCRVWHPAKIKVGMIAGMVRLTLFSGAATLRGRGHAKLTQPHIHRIFPRRFRARSSAHLGRPAH